MAEGNSAKRGKRAKNTSVNSLLGWTYRYRPLRERWIERSLACNAAVAVRTVADKRADEARHGGADAAVLARLLLVPATVEGEGAAGAAAGGAGLGGRDALGVCVGAH